ncbi:TonB-dependent receptor [Compostibacter hankyongensis]|uniref:TonB-dependent receptor n=1 Tax=Compostibacter hankyongensis TaxID=1007089 RepID=A0ABP8FFD5_9BACT
MKRNALHPFGFRHMLWMALLTLLMPLAAVAQQGTDISGTVQSAEDHEPIVGVTVRMKNTSLGTTTDVNGRFSLRQVPPHAILVFTAVGFTAQEKQLQDTKPLDIYLQKSDAGLDEVVVVGYGTQKKVNLTGAISQVDGKVLENRPVTNALAALQGTASGMVITRSTGKPGDEGYAIQVRGRSSVNGSEPFVLIDGAPASAAHIAMLNPDDIAAVSVLKDAAAAAIYGARAANGVILITTKSGKPGQLRVSYNGMWGMQKYINLPGRIHSWVDAEMDNEGRRNAGQSDNWSQQQIDWMKDPDVNYVVDPANPSVYQYYYDFDQLSPVLHNYSATQNHNLSLEGGSDKDKYFISLGYFDQHGIYKIGPDKTDRLNARLNYNRQLSGKLNLDTRITYSQENTLAPPYASEGYGGLLYLILTRGSMEPIYLPGSDNKKYAASYLGLPANTYSILKDGGKDDSRSDNFNAVVSLKASELVKGLTLRAIYAPGIAVTQEDIIKRTIPYWNVSGISDYGYQKTNPNALSKRRGVTLRNNLQFLADYDTHLGSKHSLHALGGYSFEDYRFDYTLAGAKGLSSNDLFSLNLGDPTLAANSDGISTWALLSFFGRLNYNYDERFLLEANLRYDGSSKLAPVNRWQAFPSVSVGWRLNNERWFQNALPFFDAFKIRASWGQVGNSEGVIGDYDYIALINSGTVYPFNNQRNKSFYQGVLASPEKTWETIESSNVGLDMSLLDQRLNISGDYFIKRNKDMLAPLQVSSIIGITTSTYNIADMKTWGWEASVEWRDVAGKSLSYWVNFNLSDNQNKILSYNGRNAVTAGLNGIIEGLPYNTFFGYIADGYYKSEEDVAKSPVYNNVNGPGDLKYRDMNGDNKINGGLGRTDDHGDLVNLGSPAARYTFGLNMGLGWKGIDFSAFFQGVGKRNIFPDPKFLMPFVERWRHPMDFQTDYWTPENPDALLPRLYYQGTQNTAASSHWVMNAAYVRLKNLQVGYTLPSSLTQRIKISKVRIYFSGQDLWEADKLPLNVLDPEVPNNSAYQYPYFRTFSLGLNIVF